MRTLSIFTPLMLACLAAGCGRSDTGDQPAPRTTLTLCLAPSRAAAGVDDGTWGGMYDEDPGEEFESQIRAGSVTLILRTLPGHAEICRMVMTLAGTTSQGSIYEGSTTTPLPTGAVQAEVLANTTSTATEPTFSLSDVPQGLPMWGVSEVTLTDARMQKLGVVELLRAVAKAEVVLAPDLRNDSQWFASHRLTGVSVDTYNSQGYVRPSLTTVATTGALHYRPPQDTFNPLSRSASGLQFQNVNNADTLFRAYLPEMPGGSNIALSMDYVDAAGQTTQYNWAAMATVGEPVIRNHCYRWVIRRVESDVLFTYYVCGWHQHTIDLPPFE